MKKKLLAIISLVLIACFTLSACGAKTTDTTTTTDTTSDQKGLSIFMYVVQSLGNLSCEDLIYESVTEFCNETGSTLNYFEAKSDDSLADTTLNEICSSGDYDIIITGYWNMPEYVVKAAQNYPDQKWIVFDAQVDYTQPNTSNIMSFSIEQNTLAFMAGSLAALLTESNGRYANPEKVIGFVGGGQNTAIEDFLVGYIEGAHYVDPAINVLYSYVGNWDDSAKAKELALAQYNEGADVTFGVCAPASFGCCEAAAETQRYNIGVDSDHSGILEKSGSATANYVVTSAIKQFGWMMKDVLYTVLDGTAVWGQHKSFGVETGYLTLIETPQFKELFEDELPDEYAKYQQIVADLTAGKIKVDTAFGATEAELQAIKDGASGNAAA
ncbi:MAG: BMP family ABC transporter substrate-binding protein [Oscillospiraceae bacterium]|nr:BMP family ABC transporter substrate-binding protein [Oscillospiraceae bacterium]